MNPIVEVGFTIYVFRVSNSFFMTHATFAPRFISCQCYTATNNALRLFKRIIPLLAHLPAENLPYPAPLSRPMSFNTLVSRSIFKSCKLYFRCAPFNNAFHNVDILPVYAAALAICKIFSIADDTLRNPSFAMEILLVMEFARDTAARSPTCALTHLPIAGIAFSKSFSCFSSVDGLPLISLIYSLI